MEGLRNVQNTSLSSALSPSRMDGSIKAGAHGCPRWVAPLKHHPEIRANQGGEHVRSHDTIVAQFLVCEAHTAVIFSPPCYGLATLDTRRKLLI
jgi:hypothetical protein